MKKLAVISMMLTFFSNAFAQNISREEANNLMSDLRKSKQDTSRISLLLKIAKFHIFKLGEAKADLDSGLVLINQAEQLNKILHSVVSEGNILLHKAYYLKENGQRDNAKIFAEKAVTVLKNESNRYLLGEAYFELSEYYPFETELEKKISLVQRAIVCFEQSGPIVRKAYCYKVLGNLFYQMDKKENIQKALAALDSSLKFYKAINYVELQGVYILYASIYAHESDYRQALHYALLAVQATEQTKDTSLQLCQINYITGVIFVHLHEHEKAFPYLFAFLGVAEKNHDINSIYLLQYAICVAYLEINKAIDAKKS